MRGCLCGLPMSGRGGGHSGAQVLEVALIKCLTYYGDDDSEKLLSRLSRDDYDNVRLEALNRIINVTRWRREVLLAMSGSIEKTLDGLRGHAYVRSASDGMPLPIPEVIAMDAAAEVVDRYALFEIESVRNAVVACMARERLPAPSDLAWILQMNNLLWEDMRNRCGRLVEWYEK